MSGRSPRSRPRMSPDGERHRQRGLKLLPLRTAMVTIRFSPAERDRAEELARGAGLSISAYGRLKMIDAPLQPRPERPVPRTILVVPEINQLAYRALAGAANNLNQVAHAINRGDGLELRQVQDAISRLAQGVRQVGLQLIGGE